MNSLPACDEWFECNEKYIDNSVNIAIIVVGIKGAIKIKNTLEKRFKLKEQKNDNL